MDAADGIRFRAALEGRGRGVPTTVAARSVLVATGLRETLPAIPSLRAFYGMTLFSCAACDGWELRDRPLALIGESADLADRALLISRWTDRLTVFTNGAPVIDAAEEATLAARGIRVRAPPHRRPRGRPRRGHRRAPRRRRPRADRRRVRAPAVASGARLPRGLDPATDADGNLVTDGSGRTSIPGLYAAGDAATPGPQQLIVAAGAGARVAAVLTHDLLGVTTAH